MKAWMSACAIVLVASLSVPACAASATVEGMVEHCHDPAGSSYCVVTATGKRVVVAYEWQLEQNPAFRWLDASLMDAENTRARVRVTGPMSGAESFDDQQLTKVAVEVVDSGKQPRQMPTTTVGKGSATRISAQDLTRLIADNSAAALVRFKRGAAAFAVDGWMRSMELDKVDGRDIAAVRLTLDRPDGVVLAPATIYCLMRPEDAASLNKKRKYTIEGHLADILDRQEQVPTFGVITVKDVVAVDCTFR